MDIPLWNDLALFGKRLNDPRLQAAFAYGWLLTKDKHNGVTYYRLVAPRHFECVKNQF